VHVHQLARSLTAKEFLAWETYAGLEPFDETRADYRAASIATMIANVNRGKGQKAYKLEDFVLKFEQEPQRQQTWQEQLKIMQLLARAHATDPDPKDT
jgi:hypothetical protein